MSEKSFEKISLCVVRKGKDERDVFRLERLADLVDNKLCIFNQDDNDDPYFENKKMLPLYEEYILGQYGYWKWTCSPNNKNENTDYVKTEYCPDYPLIVVLFDRSVGDSDTMVKYLKNGLGYGSTDNSYMYIYNETQDRKFHGILCPAGSLVKTNKVFRLKEEVKILIEYECSRKDLIQISPQLVVMARHDLSMQIGTILLERPEEIVKTTVINYLTWNKFHELTNGTHKEHQILKEFLNAVPTFPIIDKIMELCHCEETEAKEYLHSFLQNIESYFDVSSIEADVLRTAIESSPVLRDKMMAEANKIWTEENAILIDEACLELEKLQKEAEQKSIECKKINEEIEEKKILLEKLEEEVQTHTIFEKNFLDAFNSKIENAKKNTADFLSDYIMFQPSGADKAKMVSETLHSRFINGRKMDECDYLETQADLIEFLEDNLNSAGVKDDECTNLALYLLTVYLSKESICLIGPKGEQLINVFSATVENQTAGIINCEGEWNIETMRDAVDSSNGVILIKNPFNPNWYNRLIGYIEKTPKMFVLIHPFIEDMVMEPNGLYSYVLPLYTEPFVEFRSTEKKRKSKNKGSLLTETLHDQILPSSESLQKIKTKTISCSDYIKGKWAYLLTLSKQLDDYDDLEIDFNFKYFFLPYAMSTGQVNEFCEEVKRERHLNATQRDYYLNYFNYREEE